MNEETKGREERLAEIRSLMEKIISDEGAMVEHHARTMLSIEDSAKEFVHIYEFIKLLFERIKDDLDIKEEEILKFESYLKGRVGFFPHPERDSSS